MPLLRLPEPFDHPDWLFEVKHDGFRALAHIDGHHCDLVSRNGHTFTLVLLVLVSMAIVLMTDVRLSDIDNLLCVSSSAIAAAARTVLN